DASRPGIVQVRGLVGGLQQTATNCTKRSVQHEYVGTLDPFTRLPHAGERGLWAAVTRFSAQDMYGMTRKLAHDSEGSFSSVPPGRALPPRILRLKEVCKVVGLGRSFVYRLQGENRFPHSIRIGERAVGWLEDEVHK